MILEVKDLSKVFRVGRRQLLHAVRGVSLDVVEGEILGLVGESGCGKSTLGKTLVKLHPETSGSLRFKGIDICGRLNRRRNKDYSRQVQMIFQDPYSCLNPRMTVLDIISEGPDAHGMWSKSERKQKACEWLERVGLNASHISRYPHEFSGGQRQRIGIARALALEPQLVICDEPISALDVSVQAQVIQLLKELQVERSLTYIFIAHDLSMVRAICDRMAVMYLGSIVEIGPAREVYDSPQHPYTQALIAANPLPDPRAERTRKRKLVEGEIGSPINPPDICMFAPRCPQAIEQCWKSSPPLRALSETASVACHLFNH